MKPKTKQKLLHKYSARHLHPESCGSNIRWTLSLTKTGKNNFSFDSEVNLSDCSHSITWSGYGVYGLDAMDIKIANAIAELELLRNQLAEARRVWRRNHNK